MPCYIIKIKDYYLEWSTIVDAPITYGMKIDEFKKYYKEEYGRQGIKELERRWLPQVDKTGSSTYINNETAEDIVSINRAGPNEDELTFDEIYKAYCLREKIRNNWEPR